MIIKFKCVARKILIGMLKACTILIHIIKVPYWILVKVIIKYFGKRGLHSITIGQFVGGAFKTRSVFREEMLLPTMLLFLPVKGKTCLDLACSDGYWSFRLARFGLRSVTGIDCTEECIAKANFLKYIYDFPSFQYKQQDISEFLYDNKPACFDIILLLGIMYHLPENTNWNYFFKSLSRINNECIIIDSRWFEDDAYWYDKTSNQAVIKTEKGLIKKWRPSRNEVYDYLYEAGYEQLVEVNPSGFLLNKEEAYGNGDPYTKQNVSDYITGNRTVVVAYKKSTIIPNIIDRLAVQEMSRAHSQLIA